MPLMRIRQNKLWIPRTLNISGFTKGDLDKGVCGSVSAGRWAANFAVNADIDILADLQEKLFECYGWQSMASSGGYG